MSYANVIFGPDGAQYSLPANAAAKGASGAPATVGGLPSGGGRLDGGRPGVLPCGTMLMLQDGRKFRFAECGGVTLVVGNLISSAAILTTDQDMTPAITTPATGSIGDRLFSFTHGAATVVQNFFAEGYAIVTITPGLSDMYRINNHLALQNAVAGDVVNFEAGSALRRAITASTRISLYAHPYSGVIQCAATITGAPVGVAITAIPNAKFGYLQTAGPCAVLGVGTLLIGSPAGALISGGTAGAVAPLSATTQPVVGHVLGVEATTQASWINLHLDY